MITIAALLTASLFSMDMLLKQHVEEQLELNEERELIQDRILVRKVYNEGFMLHTLDKHPALIKGVSLFMGAGLLGYDLVLLVKRGKRLEKAGMVLLSAGAASNIFDRLVRGKVIDYIGFKSHNRFLSRLTVNLADIWIAAGTLIVTLARIFRFKRSI